MRKFLRSLFASKPAHGKPAGSGRKAVERDDEYVPYEPTESQRLLKRATQQKRDGDLDQAITTLRQAYEAMERNGEQWGIKPFLRLPLFLQAAGQMSEALQEFSALLADGYPGQVQHRGVIACERSDVYDKMRLCLQRERRPKEAVKYGVLQKASWIEGLFIQKRRHELEYSLSDESIRAVLQPLLKKAKSEEIGDQLLRIVSQAVSVPAEIDYHGLGQAVDTLMGVGKGNTSR